MSGTGQWPPKRWIRLMVVAVLVGGIGASGFLYWLFASVPEHWIHRRMFLETTNHEDLTAMAHRVESQVLQLHSYQGPLPDQGADAPEHSPGDRTPRDPSLRRVQMTIDEANAWLSTKLDQWLAHRGVTLPGNLSQPMVHVHEGALVISARWKSPETSNVVSATLGIEITEDGLLRIERRSIRWGRLPVPYTFIEKLFDQHTSPARRKLIDDVTRMTSGDPQDPRIPYLGDISHQRMIHLLSISLREEEIDLAFRIEDAKENNPP